MRSSPGARTDDGELNITIVPSRSKLKLLGMLPKVATGAHLEEPGVSYFLARKVEVHSNPRTLLELDGDLVGTTPATFTVCPGAVEVVTPAASKPSSGA